MSAPGTAGAGAMRITRSGLSLGRPGVRGEHEGALAVRMSEPARTWLTTVLPDTALWVSEDLPTRSKSYPAEEVPVEIGQLRKAFLRQN
jgi:hypothetical protein